MLRHAAKKNGVTLEDGRSRRARLAKKHREPPKYQAIADEAVRLSKGTDLLMEEIGKRLSADSTTLTRAIRWWHDVRKLPGPDGRKRRKRLAQKSRKRGDDNWTG